VHRRWSAGTKLLRRQGRAGGHVVGHPASDPSATIEADALLAIQCLIGNPPPGSSEGITLNVKNVINFNKHLFGDNLFIID
jgi:hypothetical protein